MGKIKIDLSILLRSPPDYTDKGHPVDCTKHEDCSVCPCLDHESDTCMINSLKGFEKLPEKERWSMLHKLLSISDLEI